MKVLSQLSVYTHNHHQSTCNNTVVMKEITVKFRKEHDKLDKNCYNVK